eukprot:g37621.t1
MVTIHMYNCCVAVVDKLTFLGRYVQVDSGSNDVMGSFGIWTSKWKVKLILRAYADGNIFQPLSSFVIGWSRDYLTYAGNIFYFFPHILTQLKVIIRK